VLKARVYRYGRFCEPKTKRGDGVRLGGESVIKLTSRENAVRKLGLSFGCAFLLAQAVSAESRVIAISMDNVIHPITVEILARGIDLAKRERADLVLIRLNTPGGVLDATREAIEKILASPVPVACYVEPSGGRAASAGFFLLEAGDIAAMADGTNTGASSPVLLSGRQIDSVLRKKVENDAAALLRSLCAKRGRNAMLAETAVFEAKSFTAAEALKNKLIDVVAPDERNLFAQLDGREIVRFDGKHQVLHLARPQVTPYEPTIRERILTSISDPNIAFILLILGAFGIYVEFVSPGLIFPGVVGAIFALLGLMALAVLPIDWVGVALLLLAFACFALEIKFVSHGILAAGGVVSMILGALLLVKGPPEMRIRLSTAISVALPFAIICALLVSLVIRTRAQPVVTGASGMQDALGVALTELSPKGQVFVHGEYWNAISAKPVPAGASVRVIRVRGLTLEVEPAS